MPHLIGSSGGIKKRQRRPNIVQKVCLFVCLPMLFPLLSTLKVALLLQQQQRPASASDLTEAASTSPLPLSTATDGHNGEVVPTATTWQHSPATTSQPSAVAEVVPHQQHGCWRAEASNFQQQMDCCSLSSNPLATASPSPPPLVKCRLKVDFSQLLLCTHQQNARHFLPWSNLQSEECLAELLALIREQVMTNSRAEFSVSVGNWSGDSLVTSELFNALRSLQVHSLELLPNTDENAGHDSLDIQMPNLGLFYPRLQQLVVQAAASGNRHQRPSILGRTFLRDLPALKSLKMANVDFELDPGEEPQWLGQLERLHVENASLGQLPPWVAKCSRLERIILLGCSLDSLLALSQLASAVQIKLNGNRIQDLHRIVLKCTRLHELDLRGNEITRIAPHTLSRCHALRLLDLSDNPFGALMPDKPFLGCQRLKQLRLERIGLRHLRPEIFIGLANLKLLSLAGNPLARIDPFSFLPTRSVRTLSLANCSLTSIPLAVTQCCLLDSLFLDDNRMAIRQSMPSELLALLGRLSHFSFQRNPLLQLPRGLFLYEPIDEAQERKLADILNTLIHLPVWRLEPCTPYLWHFHLANASSPELRARVSSWDEARMRRERLTHCKPLYDTVLDGISIYRELLENSGCEASRRLRSVRAKARPVSVCRLQANPPREQQKSSEEQQQQNKALITDGGPVPTTASASAIVQFLLAPAGILPSPVINDEKPRPGLGIQSASPNSPDAPPNGHTAAFGLLHLSLGANVCLLALALSLITAIVLIVRAGGEKKEQQTAMKRSDFEEIY